MISLRVNMVSEFDQIIIPSGMDEGGFIDLFNHEFSKVLRKLNFGGNLDIVDNNKIIDRHRMTRFEVVSTAPINIIKE